MNMTTHYNPQVIPFIPWSWMNYHFFQDKFSLLSVACHVPVMLALLPGAGVVPLALLNQQPLLSPSCKELAQVSPVLLTLWPCCCHLYWSIPPRHPYPPFCSYLKHLCSSQNKEPAIKCLSSSALQLEEESWLVPGDISVPACSFLPVLQKSQL